MEALPIVFSMGSNQPAPLKSLADEALVERFQTTGERAYFEELWKRYFKSVYGKSLSFLRNPAAAEDVTAEVFLKAFASLAHHYNPGHFAGWLFTITKHQCINHVKQAAERFRGGPPDDLNVVSSGNPAGATEIESILHLLSTPQRIAIKLFYVNGFSYEEIAEIEGWCANEVKTHLQNGRRRFKLLWDRSAQGTEK